ncbi:MAG: hypothetical protein GY696_05605 [Gammaproteobacteria bacterium]|nr:hypothetical protein [Gammaproteobacteria bacterium]
MVIQNPALFGPSNDGYPSFKDNIAAKRMIWASIDFQPGRFEGMNS